MCVYLRTKFQVSSIFVTRNIRNRTPKKPTQISINKKFKSSNLELSNDIKIKSEIEHPTDWSQDCCYIFTFPLEINPTSYDADKETMSYTDFNIFKEHKLFKEYLSK